MMSIRREYIFPEPSVLSNAIAENFLKVLCNVRTSKCKNVGRFMAIFLQTPMVCLFNFALDYTETKGFLPPRVLMVHIVFVIVGGVHCKNCYFGKSSISKEC